MADNTELNAGSGGDTIALDDIGGVKYPRSKITIGANGVNDGDVSSANPLPVDLGTNNDVTLATLPDTAAGDLAAMVVDLAAIEVLITASNVDLAAIETLITAGNVDLAAIEVLLTAIDSDTNDIKTAVELMDNPVATISATPLQRVAIFDDSDSQITTFGGGTQYTEDAAAAANPTGTMPVLVRDDTPGAITGTDGDVIAQRATNYGAAFCQIVDSSGNFVDSFGGSGGTAAADDADFVAGTTQGTPSMGVYESSPTSVTDGDLGTVGITTTRSLKVEETNSGSIKTAVELIDNAVSGSGFNISQIGGSAAVAAVAGAGTEAAAIRVTLPTDGTGVVNLGATDNAVLDSIVTNTTGLAGCVAGSELQVDIVSGAGGTEYTEDVATPATITGTATMMERDDVIAPLTPVAGDWASFRCSAEGALWVQDFNSDAVLADTNSMVTDLAAIEVTQDAIVVDLAAIEVLLTQIDADTSNITACNTGAVVLSSGTVTTVSTVTNLAQMGGAAINMNAGVLGTGTQRVTIATDDEVNNLLGTIDADTSAMAVDIAAIEVTQDAIVVDLAAIEVLLTGMDVDTDAIKTAVQTMDNTVAVLGTATYSEATTSGNVVGAVRNDDLATLASADNEIAPLQVDSNGALYTNPCTAEMKSASGVAASGSPAIVSAVIGKKIRIHAFAAFATSATANTIYLATTTDTDVLGDTTNRIPIAADADGDNSAGFVLPFNPGGWTTTSTANEALNLGLSAAADIAWMITYTEVD